MEYIVRPDIFPKDKVVAFFTGKDPGADIERIAEISRFDKKDIYMPIQKHTSEVIEISDDRIPSVADAVITNRRGILLGVKVADCVPILIYSRDGVIAAVHAGWRGTAEGIVKSTLRKILAASRPEDVFIAIGPAIRWCCYKVGEDVLRAVALATGEGDYYRDRERALCLDLPSANRTQAVSLGVPEENIRVSEECTYCHPEKFHSYRYAGDYSGRQGGYIGLL